jgi:hypothetical protein
MVVPLGGLVFPLGVLKKPLGGPTSALGQPTRTRDTNPSCQNLSASLLEFSRLPWQLKDPYGQTILLTLLSPLSVLGILMTETLSSDAP